MFDSVLNIVERKTCQLATECKDINPHNGVELRTMTLNYTQWR